MYRTLAASSSTWAAWSISSLPVSVGKAVYTMPVALALDVLSHIVAVVSALHSKGAGDATSSGMSTSMSSACQEQKDAGSNSCHTHAQLRALTCCMPWPSRSPFAQLPS